MPNKAVSIAEASRLFDDRYFNPNATKDVFGFYPELPPILFSPDALENHSQKGHLLVYYQGIVDGRPLRLKELAERALSGGRNVTTELEDPFFLTKAQFGPDGNIHDTPYILPNDPLIIDGTVRSGWQLVSPDILSETRRTHAIQLVDVLVDYAMVECFDGSIPEESPLGVALARWNPEKCKGEGSCEYPCGSGDVGSERGIACDFLYTRHNPLKASQTLTAAMIPQMLLEPVQNAVYRYLLGVLSGRKLFVGGTSRTLSATTRGCLATFGVTDSAGGFIGEDRMDNGWKEENGSEKGNGWYSLGAVFSRMNW